MRNKTLLFLILVSVVAVISTGCFSFPKKQDIDAIGQLQEPAQVEIIKQQIEQQPLSNATLGLTIIGGLLAIISQLFVFLGNPRGWLGVFVGAGIAAGPWIFDSEWFKWVAGLAFAALAIQILTYGYQRFLKPFLDSRHS